MPLYYATLKSQTDDHRRFVTIGGESEEEVRERLREMEAEYVRFRLDEQLTRDRYGYPDDVLAQVEGSCSIYNQDTDEDGRFIRAGKVTGANPQQRGWLHLHNQEKPYKITSIGPMDEQMVVTAGQYGVPAKNRSDGTANGSINWASDTINVGLTTATYTVDIDTHDFWNDVTNEVTGTGYSAGGATLGSKASSYDTATDQARFDAADTSWTTSTITARRAVVYKSTGTATTSPLISYVDFGADVSTTAGTFQITWDATGIWIIDVT
jgi:hypothetical protein